MTNLTRIANKCGTDKGTEHFEKHGYTEEYAKYIPDLGKYTLIEIGVYHCDSMRMWQEYNPDMNIIGLEVDENVNRWMKSEDEYTIFVGDATKSDFIDKVIEYSKAPDFIIDDGSHKYEDIWASFCILYPKLKKGGYYFIEDLHAPQAKIGKLVTDINLYPEVDIAQINLISNDKLLVIYKK